MRALAVLLFAIYICNIAQDGEDELPAPTVLSGPSKMTRGRIDWSDLQFVLAVADRGSLASAAKALGVNHTTVLRRIQAFEAAHGVRLFDRLPSGYAVTAAGETTLGAARSMANLAEELEGRISGRDLRLEGTLRITTTDTLMVSLLPPVLAAFHEQHPGVRLDVSVGTDIANLARREADVAIRVSASPPDLLIGRRISNVAMAIYRARGDLAPIAEVTELQGNKWVTLSDGFGDTAVGRWLRSNIAEERVVLRTDSFIAAMRAAAAGLGLAALPTYLGDSAADLKRASSLVPLQPSPVLWVLSHRDLKRTARVRAFVDFAASALLKERGRLEK